MYFLSENELDDSGGIGLDVLAGICFKTMERDTDLLYGGRIEKECRVMGKECAVGHKVHFGSVCSAKG